MTAPPHPLNVAILGHTSALGGAELAICRLLNVLDRQKFDIDIVLFQSGPLADRLRDTGERVRIVALDGRIAQAHRDALLPGRRQRIASVVHTVRFMAALRSALGEMKPDVVHTNSLKAHVLGGLVARSLGLPVVFYVHDRVSPDYLPAPVAGVMRWVIRRVPHHVLVNSLATAATLAPMPAARWTLAYPGVDVSADAGADVDVLGDAAGAVDGANVAQAPRPEPAVIGIVGRISPTKGQLVFLEAAAIVRQSWPEVRFVIAGAALFGEDDYAAAVRAKVCELGLDGVVDFPGFIADIGGLLSTLSVLVHASPTPEPFGQVIVEAMVAQVPVVATRGGGVAEIMTDPGSGALLGQLVQPNDAQALGAAILTILGRPSEATDRARAAAASAHERFSVTSMSEAVTQGWTAAARRRRR